MTHHSDKKYDINVYDLLDVLEHETYFIDDGRSVYSISLTYTHIHDNIAYFDVCFQDEDDYCHNVYRGTMRYDHTNKIIFESALDEKYGDGCTRIHSTLDIFFDMSPRCTIELAK